MPNIVISGCGNIGSRLLQSVSNVDDAEIGILDIYGVDPFQSSLDLSTERFHQENKGGHNLHMSTDASDLPPEADLLIVSVDAANRLAALTAVLEHCKPKAIILEKILCNKFEDFEPAQTIIDNLQVPCWVNCSRNVWPGYQNLKETLTGKAIKSYTVTGSDWGLGCNAIHFIAALEYLADETVVNLAMDINSAAVRESKRAGYKEITGTLRGRLASGGLVSLTSHTEEGQPVEICVKVDGESFSIIEGKTITKDSNEPTKTTFPILFTSQLTDTIARILKESVCELPTFRQSTHQHKILFQALNSVFYGPDNREVQCPVT